MYCPQCGAKNQDDAVFCESCGADISQAFAEAKSAVQDQKAEEKKPVTGLQNTAAAPIAEYNYQPAAVSPAVKVRKPVKTSVKVLIGVALFLIVAVAVLYNVGLQMFSPESTAKNFFETIRAKDWNNAYSYLNVTESEFINKANFVKVMGKSSTPKIINYSVYQDKTNSKNEDAGSLAKTVTVQYTTQDNSSPQQMEIKLIKQPQKAFLFFNTWKVASTDYISDDLSISIPQGSTAFLDNTKITDKYKVAMVPADSSSNSADSANQLVTYDLPRIFIGNYTLKVTSPYTDDFSKNISVDTGNNSENIDSLKLKQSVLDDVSKKPEQILRDIYSAALAGKDVDSIKKYFAPDDNTQNNLKINYQNILDTLNKGTDGGFKKITFSNFNSSVTDSKASVASTITVETKFDYNFTAVGPTYDLAFPAQDYSGHNNGNLTFTFELSGGKWLVSDAGSLTLSAYNYDVN